MYFSNNHKLSRLLSLVIALLMTVTLFAGCQKKDTADDTTEPQLNIVDPESTPTAEETLPPETTAPIIMNENMATVLNQLNIRTSPSSEAKIVGTLDAGEQVEILRQETVATKKWGMIEDGWISMDFVKMNVQTNDPSGAGEATPEETKPKEETSTENIKGVITASELYIRAEANTTSNIQGNYKKGEVVTILETKNGWGRTSKGWIKMQYVNTTGTNTNNKDEEDKKTETGTTTTDGGTYFITASELNIRDSASATATRVGSYTEGTKVTILETKNGWGRTDKGWISMDYAYKTGAKGEDSCAGIVTATTLRVRSGPGTNYDSVGSLEYGKRVNVLERVKINGTTWGCLSNGWISMDHVYVDGTETDNSGPATITGDQLNIRSGPGTGYDSVGSLDKGDIVTVHFQLKVGDTYWACIDKGWVSMDFVELG